jgi:HlyD family secretion protein
MNEHAKPPFPSADILKTLGLDRAERAVGGRRRLLIAGGAGLALLVGLFSFFLAGGGETAGYVTAEVARRDLVVSVNATGTLEPENQVDVGPEISGRIARVLVDFNDMVTEGQVLAELDTEQLQAQLAQTEASLASARANVVQSEATVEQNRALAARTEELFNRNVVSQQDLEAARADLQRAEASWQRARADASLAAAQLDANRTSLSKAAIRSPIDGVVLDRQAEPGQAVAASFEPPVLFTLASDLSRMELLIDIDEADIGVMVPGQRATFTVDAFPQREFSAELISVRNAPNIENGVVTYEGVLSVANTDGTLRPGLTANATITVAEITDALFVPNGALRFTPPGTMIDTIPPQPAPVEGRIMGRVWVLNGGTPEARDIVVGRSDGQMTEVVSGDLAEGDEVIIDLGTPAPG